MRRLMIISAVALLAAACSTTGSDNGTPGNSPAAPNSDDGPPRSDRGAILKEVGQEGAYGSEGDCGGEPCVAFTVTDISRTSECESPIEPVEGQLLDVDLTIETKPGASETMLTGSFQTYNWSVVTTEGITKSNAQGALMSPCNADPDGLGGMLNPGSKYAGMLQFDVPADSQTLLLEVPGVDTWEWPIPAVG